MNGFRNIFINSLLVIGSVLITLLFLEIGLRFKGYYPGKLIRQFKNEPVLLENDAALGWKKKQGIYDFPAYDPSISDMIKVSFLDHGLRKTSDTKRVTSDSIPKIMFIGGSFMQGQAISDHETMAWKTQNEFPDYKVLNAGTAAYGTYQSLLVMEQLLPKFKNTKVIFYGMIDHHLIRNIVPPHWIDLLLSADKRKNVIVPSVTLKNDKLIRQPPRTYKRIPLSSTFSIVKLIERKLVNYKKEVSDIEQQRILIKLLEEMEDLSKKHNAKFVVIGLNLKNDYSQLLSKHHITVVDCKWDEEDSSFKVKGEGHPSGKTNSLWAIKVKAFLNRTLSEE